jgi:hypothetical protein
MSFFLPLLLYATSALACPGVSLDNSGIVHTKVSTSLDVGYTYNFFLGLKKPDGSDFDGDCGSNQTIEVVMSISGPGFYDFAYAVNPETPSRYDAKLLVFLAGDYDLAVSIGNQTKDFTSEFTFIDPNPVAPTPVITQVSAFVIGNATVTRQNEVPTLWLPEPIPCLTDEPLANIGENTITDLMALPESQYNVSDIFVANLEDIYTLMMVVENAGDAPAYDVKISWDVSSCFKPSVAQGCEDNLRIMDKIGNSSIPFIGDASTLFSPTGLIVEEIPAGDYAVLTVNVQFDEIIIDRNCDEEYNCQLGQINIASYANEAGGLSMKENLLLAQQLDYRSQEVVISAPNPDPLAATDFGPAIIVADGGLRISSGIPIIRIPVLYHSIYYNSIFNTGEECFEYEPSSFLQTDGNVTCHQYWFIDINYLANCNFTEAYTMSGKVQVTVNRNYSTFGSFQEFVRTESAPQLWRLNLDGTLQVSGNYGYCFSKEQCLGFPCINGFCACRGKNYWHPGCKPDVTPPTVICPRNYVLPWSRGDELPQLLDEMGQSNVPKFSDDQPPQYPLNTSRIIDNDRENSKNYDGWVPDFDILAMTWTPGTHTITYEVSDYEGNTASCSFQVQVLDLAINATVTIHNSTDMEAFLVNYSQALRPELPATQYDFLHDSDIGVLVSIGSRNVLIQKTDLIWLNVSYYVDNPVELKDFGFGLIFETPLYGRDIRPDRPPQTKSVREYSQHAALVYNENQFPEASRFYMRYVAMLEITFVTDPYLPASELTPQTRRVLAQFDAGLGTELGSHLPRRSLAEARFFEFEPTIQFAYGYAAVYQPGWNVTVEATSKPTVNGVPVDLPNEFPWEFPKPPGVSEATWCTLGFTMWTCIQVICCFMAVWWCFEGLCCRRKRRRGGKGGDSETNNNVNVVVEMTDNKSESNSNDKSSKKKGDKGKKKKKKKKKKKDVRRDQISPYGETRGIDDSYGDDYV